VYASQSSGQICGPLTPASSSQTLIERVNNLELQITDAQRALQWAHERISFLESSLGTAAPQNANSIPAPKGY
jgi:hypothetical protein